MESEDRSEEKVVVGAVAAAELDDLEDWWDCNVRFLIGGCFSINGNDEGSLDSLESVGLVVVKVVAALVFRLRFLNLGWNKKIGVKIFDLGWCFKV